MRKPPTLKSTRIRIEEKIKKSVKREESQTTILIEENQRSIAKENQTCINAEKSKASIPENQLNGDFWAFLSYFSSVFTEKKCSLNHLTIGSYVSVRSSRYEVRGKFREHERCVRVAPGKLPKRFISRWTHSWFMKQLFHNIFNPMEIFFSRGIFVCWRLSVHNMEYEARFRTWIY